MSESGFHTIREPKLSVRVLVFSVLNVSELIRGVDMCKKLEETMHLHVRHFCQLLIYFNFFQIFFFQNLNC